MRKFRLHFQGPAPYGGTYHTCRGDAAIARLLADGWTLYRVNEIPSVRLASDPPR